MNEHLFHNLDTTRGAVTMGDASIPEKDLEKLSKEQEKEDAAFLDNLVKESKEFDKVRKHDTQKRSAWSYLAIGF